MAGSPDAGACWRGGWPVVSADRPWRVLGVIVGFEKYSFDIFDLGIWSLKNIWCALELRKHRLPTFFSLFKAMTTIPHVLLFALLPSCVCVCIRMYAVAECSINCIFHILRYSQTPKCSWGVSSWDVVVETYNWICKVPGGLRSNPSRTSTVLPVFRLFFFFIFLHLYASVRENSSDLLRYLYRIFPSHQFARC